MGREFDCRGGSKPRAPVSLEETLLNHLTLPAQLPQQQDVGLEKIESGLLSRLEDAAICLRDLPGNRSRDVWQSVCRSLASSRSITGFGRLDKAVLEAELRRLDNSEFLMLYIREQNAAVSIHRSADEVIFEVCEASPRCKDVLATKSALQWDFPGSAVAVPYDTILDFDFLSSLCLFLEQASAESIKDFAAHTYKAGMNIVEERDTKDPRLMSSMFIAILEANGRRLTPTRLRKRVRDDVLWRNAAMPWRRLPFWLIIRVSIQRHLLRQLPRSDLDADCARMEYKLLVCVLLAGLLDDVRNTTTPDRLAHLKAKVCRRLAKLDVEMETASSEAVASYRYYLNHLTQRLEGSVQLAGTSLQARWESFKNASTRSILPLPSRADPDTLRLSLEVGSLDYLRRALDRFRKTNSVIQWTNRPSKDDSAQQSSNILEPYFRLAETEWKLQDGYALPGGSDSGMPCLGLATSIRQYIGNVGDLYAFSVEQKSTMLLTVMELWVRVDMEACEHYPLLRHFHPSFISEILDVLHLPQWGEMMRVRRIQAYLQLRIDQCASHMTIFDSPREGCFAQRFYDEAPEGVRLQKLLEVIKKKSQEARQAKEEEWREKNALFETLTRQHDRTVCTFLPDTAEPQNRRFPRAQNHDPDCHKCAMGRQLRSLRIGLWEDSLPADDLMTKIVLFELGGYRQFEAYRDITYFLIVRLGTQTVDTSLPPKCSVREYVQLKEFARGSEPSFRLVSTTKSFLNTHYAGTTFPVALNDVLRSNGHKYTYYDQTTETYARRIRRPTFGHLCASRLPDSSPLATVINASLGRGVDPSSYDIIASQATCPIGVNLHEFLAVQSLLAGTSRRWLSLLAELGASNINFSTEATAIMVGHVANQCGPPADDDEILGANHTAFRDAHFHEVLLRQIAYKMEGIASNWREVFTMETVITVTQRASVLSGENFKPAKAARNGGNEFSSSAILMRAREITLNWVLLLRDATKEATDLDTVRRYQTYTLWAALLCKRTFNGSFTPDALPALVLCCITLQDHLATSHDFSSSLKSAIIRDTKMMYSMKRDIEKAIKQDPHALLRSFGSVWEDAGSQELRIEDWHLASDSGCISLTIASEGDHFREQAVVYNYMHGVLLVDGMAIGKLPSDHSSSAILTELFGNQSLLTRPSRMRDMQYTLCIAPYGHQIHIGFFGDQMVIRSHKGQMIWELVPRNVFGSPRYFDLPGPLINQCFHWLDLSQGKFLEIRPRNQMWISNEQHWRLDLSTAVCSRTRFPYRDVLVDPHARLFHRAARNLEGLESRSHILVYQREWRGSHKSSVFIDLPRLQLTFYHSKGTLFCPQYRANVAQDQNIGTWHGLKSMLVLEESNSRKRMVLVPFGAMSSRRDGDHLAIDITGNGSFGMFRVNDILKRIECAPEPKLIYHKALLHAYTSFELPDDLTGMTGSESALHWLSSGLCQPWSPLAPPHLDILRLLAHLTPRQDYYPASMKVMKTELWDHNLTTTVQLDAYASIVKRLIDRSEALSAFHSSPDQQITRSTNAPSEEAFQMLRDHHLNLRSWTRWQATHRISYFTKPPEETSDELYRSRDGDSSTTTSYLAVREISWLLSTDPTALRSERNLAMSLSQCPLITGYSKVVDKADKASISERLSSDMKHDWGTLVSLALKYRDNKPWLMWLLGPMVFHADPNMDLARSIVAFALFDELAAIKLPSFPQYEHFRIHQRPDEKYLSQLAKPARMPAPYDEREDIPSLSGKLRRQLEQQKSRHEQMSEEGCDALAQHLLLAWPCAEPKIANPRAWDDSLLDIEKALAAIRPEWTRLFENMQFSAHLDEVQAILTRRYSDEAALPAALCTSTDHEECTLAKRQELLPLMDDLLFSSHHTGLPSAMPLSRPLGLIQNRHTTKSSTVDHAAWKSQTSQWTQAAKASAAIQELSSIIVPYSESTSRIKQRYGRDLQESLEAFRAVSSRTNIQGHKTPFAVTETEALKHYLNDRLRHLASRLPCPGTAVKLKWLSHGQLLPIISPVTLLERLRSTNLARSGRAFTAIVEFGLIVTAVQKQMRLNEFAFRNDQTRYNEEFDNMGHQTWNPRDYPDWLLLEIESDILIRPSQVDVAIATILPPSGSNSVLQMNMGQGKTSVVIPMVAAVIANGKSLARIVVPKALLQQNAQLIHSRLGGLLGREIGHVPFSRKTPTDHATLQAYVNLHKHMRQHGGVLLCLPEHNMSFMLSGIQKLLDENVPEAQMMIRTWRALSNVSRDVLDESDYTLATRTQLIYPSGGLTVVHGHPHRWIVAQLLLSQVQSHLRVLKRLYPRSLEVVWRPGAFPFVYFLRPDVEDQLLLRLTSDIFNGRTEMLPISTGFSLEDREAVRDFISNAKVKPSTLQRIRNLCPDKNHIRQTVYLLRGLLVNRILLSCMKKRWNVQYGLHPTREPIAVPYSAKGVPSDSSEWGHPDVSILFTCMSFYYQGISVLHLKQALQHLLKSDDPAAEYDSWTSSPSFPDSLRDWTAINIDDECQLRDVWSAVRLRVVVINYFLNNFVFPLYAKQFKVKIQASGWDIPLLQSNTTGPDAAKPLTTGFSGTNDTKNMLPLTIQQQDLPGLSHTNAEVLTYLLHQRNRTYIPMTTPEGNRLGEERFLGLLTAQRIRVLIDAGAQILEMSNRELATRWLEIDGAALAALYFDASGKPWILARRSMNITPLLASQYADNLHGCLIYLDEAHTRGTDLKLPPNARGALTLGLGQTKDHTVQAAMRLRQLGTTQEVVFFAPPEVHQSILDLTGKQSKEIDSRDVIHWLLDNTCESIEALQPLYYSQGVDFCRRMQAVVDYPDFLSDSKQRESYVATIRQDEQQTLEQLYGPRTKTKKAAALKKTTDPLILEFTEELEARRRGFEDTGRAVHASALQEVEQEREVEMQVESVRQVRKALRFSAHKWPGLHKDLEVFARTGHLPAQSQCCVSLWSMMSRTWLGRKFKVSANAVESKLLVSVEFERTVKDATERLNDDFIRPVSWLLWSNVSSTAIVVIPEEAEALLPIVRNAQPANTVLMTYAAPVIRRMLHFNNLDYYTVPALPRGWKAPLDLKVQLGILAGRLYFEWNEYAYLAEFLGLRQHSEANDGLSSALDSSRSLDTVETDGTAESRPVEVRQASKQPTKLFAPSPLTFMQEWLAVRRRGQDVANTPLGFITQGKPLTADHPFFRQDETEERATLRKATARIVPGQENVEEVIYEGGIDVEVSDIGSSSEGDGESDIEYHDDELYSSENEEEPGQQPVEHGRRGAGGRRRDNGSRARGGGRGR